MPDEKGRFVKGDKGGRPPGTPNKLTSTVKETVLKVFNELQESPKNNLTAFAEKYPRDFYAIAAKLIPTEINAKLNKIQLEIIRTTTDDSQPGTDSTEAEDTSQEPTSSL